MLFLFLSIPFLVGGTAVIGTLLTPHAAIPPRRRPQILRPALLIKQHQRTVTHDRSVLAQRATHIVSWQPALDDAPAKLFFGIDDQEHVIQEGGRLVRVVRDHAEAIAAFLGVTPEDIQRYCKLGQSVIWEK